MSYEVIGGIVVAGLLLFFAFIVPVLFRIVVSTNEVHIVQKSKSSFSYGKDTGNGNVYYKFPAWVPSLGVQTTVLPFNNFNIELDNYEAYDKGRLPFVVDVMAFFRVADPNTAAQRVESFAELKKQLESIVQGSVRSILASSEIEEIMQGRGKFGEEFTKEVSEQLKNWGVETVKNIELMDIRDSQQSKVIHQIMDKKKSHIEMESRQEVAKNNQVAKISEIEAAREIELKQQLAAETIGLRRNDTERAVLLAEETKKQQVAETSKNTAQKQMELKSIQDVKGAEIARSVRLVKADEDKQAAVIRAEQEKETQVKLAEGRFESVKKQAEGAALEGKVKADNEAMILMAPVTAQVELAQKIGENKPYQDYLVQLKQVEATRDIGVEQAKAVQKAEIKIIANAGTANAGLKSALDIFSSNGGIQLAALLEGFSSSDIGKATLAKMGINTTDKKELQ